MTSATFIGFVQLHTGKPGYSGMSNVHTRARRSVLFEIDTVHDVALNVDAIEWCNTRRARLSHFTLWRDPVGTTHRDRLGGGALTVAKDVQPGDTVTFAVGAIVCDG